MRRSAIVLLMTAGLLMAQLTPSLAQAVTLRAENVQARGWGAGGWGSYRFVLKNDSQTDVTVLKWSAEWVANGKTVGDKWGGEINQPLAAGKEVTRDEVAVLPESVATAVGKHPATIAGVFSLKEGDHTVDLQYRISVSVFVMPEPLKLVKGKTVGMDLMESRYKTFKHIDRTLEWIDECYSAMIDLTGEKPFGGKLMVYKESPPHPWWAYAGQEMILNTDYVGSTLKDFDDGLISFGWVHEVGHNFDEKIGKWYIWSGPAAEWQANFKLSYAMESIPDQSFRIKWSFQAPGYPAPDPNIRLTGHELVERFFVMFGDAYLADPSRKWDTLSSDEMHTFFQRIQRVYGWPVFKGWYRTYRRMEDAGMKPPDKSEEKISLIAAILSSETKVNLLPIFIRWRLPVTEDSVKAMREKYKVDEMAVRPEDIH